MVTKEELIHELLVVNFLESALDKCLTFFIITTSLILLLICVLGFSIYHVVMIKGDLTMNSLLNHLYLIMAVVVQFRSCSKFSSILIKVFSLENWRFDCGLRILNHSLTMIGITNIFALTGAHFIKHKSQAKYLEISVNRRLVKRLVLTELCLAAVLITVKMSFCSLCDNICYSSSTSLFIIPVLVCLLVILKIADCKYFGLLDKCMTSIRNWKNKMTSQVDFEMDENTSPITPINQKVSDQCVCFITLFKPIHKCVSSHSESISRGNFFPKVKNDLCWKKIIF